MPDPSLERRFAVLSQIVRAQHFAWREAVRQTCPDTDPAAVVHRMWQITGEETAKAYLGRIDPARPLALQVAEMIVFSSRCMGEEADAEPGEGPEEAFVRHTDCPWHEWHERHGLLEEDRPACDAWFRATLDALGRALGRPIRFETRGSLPEGDPCCLRRLWVGEPGAEGP